MNVHFTYATELDK